MNYKLFSVLAVFSVVLLAGCVQAPGAQNASQADALNASEKLSSQLGSDWESKYPELAAKIKRLGTPYVSTRGDYLPEIVFSELPSYPKDFDEIQLLVYIGRISDMNLITSNYWKQPEFYPQFVDQGVPLYQHPPTDRWGAFGYGTYPSETMVFSPRNAEWNVSFFMHTSWQVQTYQGMGFDVIYPASGRLLQSNFQDGNKTVVQDPEKTMQYFDVEVTPQEMLLEPAFPIFKEGWTQKVTVKVRAKDVPPGRYVIGLDIGGPSQETNDEWFWKYKTQYVGSAGMHGIGQPWYQIFIEVE